jgi:hypothetical protein
MVCNSNSLPTMNPNILIKNNGISCVLQVWTSMLYHLMTIEVVQRIKNQLMDQNGKMD